MEAVMNVTDTLINASQTFGKKAKHRGRKEEEEEPLLIYTAQGSPFRCKKLSVINGSPERNNVLKLCIHMHYTNTNNNIDRELCTNKRFRSK